MPAKRHQFLWFDLETTGLNPHDGAVLEFAAVLAADACATDLGVLQQYTGTVHYDRSRGQHTIDPYVEKMHNANGLWDDALASTTTIEEVDTFLAGLCVSLGAAPRQVRLAGSSVQFDLAWARVHLPRFAKYLSHRVLDVTTLRAAIDLWLPECVQWPVREAHRALPDILTTLEEASVCARVIARAT